MDKWIYEPPSDSDDEFKSNDLTFMMASGGNDAFNGPAVRTKKSKKRKGKKGGVDEEDGEEEDDEEMEKVRLLLLVQKWGCNKLMFQYYFGYLLITRVLA